MARRKYVFVVLAVVTVLVLTLFSHVTLADTTSNKKSNHDEEETLAVGLSNDDRGVTVTPSEINVADAKDGATTRSEWVLREVPTREEDGWRRLKEGESVPRGSHVQLNMTSGERWVKDDSMRKNKVEEGASAEISRGERILQLLENIPNDKALSKRVAEIRSSASSGTDEFERLAAELWDERQKELTSGKNDTSIASTDVRVTTLTKSLHPPELVSEELLIELDELVEDLDEATTFANEVHKGIQKCLAIIEHAETSGRVKTLAAGVIGKAIKLTAPLQNTTVALGGFEIIKRAFKQGTIVESKALFSLGSLLRGSEEAAMEALRHPDFFESLVVRLSRVGTDHKIREKASALVGDLLLEPKEWCWNAFKNADLCQSSLDFTEEEISNSAHFEYLHTIRAKVCKQTIGRDEV